MLSRPPRSTRIYSLCSYTTLFRAADGGSGSLFRYAVSHSAAVLRARRKSTYYSTEMSEALSSIAGDGKRYAFVGVPCFVKAISLLMRQDARLAEQIRFRVGLVCGHLKSAAFEIGRAHV